MLRPATWADVAHIPSTTFHMAAATDDGENMSFQLEEVVGEGSGHDGGLALAPLPTSSLLDLQFGFDDIGAMPSMGLTPSSAIHFSVSGGPAVNQHGDAAVIGDGLFSGDDSDVSSTPSTPPPLSPVFKTENITLPVVTNVNGAINGHLHQHTIQQTVLHYGQLGYPSPGSESFSSVSSSPSPDHSCQYDLDPVPGVTPIGQYHPMMSLPVAPSQNGSMAIPSSSSSVGSSSSSASSRGSKRRRAANGNGLAANDGTGSGSDDSTSKSRMAWIPAAEAKSATNDDDDDDDDDEDDTTDGKKAGRRGKGASAAGVGKQSKRERNKLSASKYRKRRKQYLDGLEGKCNELQAQLNTQTKKINSLTTENKLLKENVDFLKNLLGYKNVKTTPHTGKLSDTSAAAAAGHHSHHNTNTFASNAGGGAAAATGVILFAFFACFLLFTPPIVPRQHFVLPADVAPAPSSSCLMGRPAARTILQECLVLDRQTIDDTGCCICPGDEPIHDILTRHVPPPPSAPPLAANNNNNKEQSAVMDVNGHIITPSTTTISVATMQVNDTITNGITTDNNSAPQTAAAA